MSCRQRLQEWLEEWSPVVHNTAWLMSDRIVRMFVGLALGVWIARHLGPSQFGLLEFGIAWIAIFTPMATLGLEGIAVREMVNRPEHQASIVLACVRAKLLGGALCGIIAPLALLLYRPQEHTLLAIATVLGIGVVFQAADAYDFLFQARMQNGIVVRAKGIGLAIATSCRIALLYFEASVQWFAVATTVELAASAILLRVAYQRTPKAPHGQIWEETRHLLRNSWPLAFSSVMIIIYMKINQVLIEALSSFAELGHFAAAVRIAEAWYFVPLTIVSALFPKIIEARRESEARFRGSFRTLYRIIGLTGYAFAIAVTLFSEEIIAILFGREFQDAARPLAILAWSGVFVGMGVARSAYLTAMNWTRFHLLSVSVGCVTSLIGGYLLIPLMGATGAAIATLLAYFMASHVVCLFDRDLWPTAKDLFLALIPRMSMRFSE